MTVTRPLCAAFALITLSSALWFPSAASCATLPAGTTSSVVAPAAMSDDEQTPDAGEAPPFKPFARVSSLMAGIGSAFGKIGEALPQTDDEHRLDAITAWSEVIAELSNVNTQHRRKPDSYLEMAADTRSIALELSRAARAEVPDEAQLKALFTNLDNSCSTCHDADH